MPPLSPFNQIPSLGKWLATNAKFRTLELAPELNAKPDCDGDRETAARIIDRHESLFSNWG